jgi:hypothetical protein
MTSVIDQRPDIAEMEVETKHEDPSKLEQTYSENVEGGTNMARLTDLEGAVNAEAAEQAMTFKEAIRDYPNAVFWSFAISLCIIMEGYDTALPVSGLRRLDPIPFSDNV